MMRAAALLWLAAVLVALGYLLVSLRDGLPLRTDLLALLPRESADGPARRATEMVSRNLSRRVAVAVGHPARDRAREAAARLSADLMATGLLEPALGPGGPEGFRRLGELYYPHRGGLLPASDRELLEARRGREIAGRALAQAYGVGGVADAKLLRDDPFLLLPSFLAGLPLPMSRVTMDDGVLTASGQDKTWVLILANLKDEPFALDVQERLTSAFDRSASALRTADPLLEVKRTGAVFFAAAGAAAAIREASMLGLLATVGTVLLIVLVFRHMAPLFNNIVVLASGISVGLAGSLAVFGELHVAALLFGSSLVGVAVDYSLHYSATVFDGSGRSARDRLATVLPGLSLGLATTVLGYVALALAPLSGLRQVAVFSAIGAIAAYLSVVLWLPYIDRSRPLRHGPWMLAASRGAFAFWEAAGYRFARAGVLCAVAAAALIGITRLDVNDDMRRMQTLAPGLVAEQEALSRLIGIKTATEFVLVEAPDDETALRTWEGARHIVSGLVRDGAVKAALAPADFVPSAERRSLDRSLIEKELKPLLEAQRAALGLGEETSRTVEPLAPLTLVEALRSDAVPLLRDLVLAPGLHVVALDGLVRPAAVRAAFEGRAGLRLVEPTAEFGALLGKYRQRTMMVVALSAGLIVLLLSLRYGWAGAAWVMTPPLLAMVLAPALLALFGQPFTFFDAMALVLVLAIGVDYALFCAESSEDHRATTMLSIGLAMLTTLFSFGLLAFSGVPAIHNFGSTMLLGISLAFLLAPLASRCGHHRRAVLPLARFANISRPT